MRKYYFALVVSLFTLIGCDEILYHGLSEQQANEILVALADRGIGAQKLQDGSLWNVVTEKEQLGNALLVLRRYRLPRVEIPIDNDSTSFLPGREEREYRRERQISRNLENTLMVLPGMVEARVHLSLATRAPLGIDPVSRAASASVLLIHRADTKVDLNAVKSIVSGASGIHSSQIAVVDRDSDEGDGGRNPESSPLADVDAIHSGNEILPPELTFSFASSKRDSKLALTLLAAFCFCASALGVVSLVRRSKKNHQHQIAAKDVSSSPIEDVEQSDSDSIFSEVFIENGRIVRRQEFLQ